MNLTVEQNNIVDLSPEDFLILLIQALAGTGKTTTLIEYIINHQNIQFKYLSFNNKIVQSFSEKSQKLRLNNVSPNTFHAFSKKYTSDFFKNQNLVNKLSFDIVSDFFPEEKSFEIYSIIKWFNIYTIQQLKMKDFIKKIKNISKKEKFELKMHERKDYVLSILKKVEELYNGIINDKTTFYTHNSYMKYFIDNMEDFDFEDFEVLLVDEAQDLNPIMINLIIVLLKKKKKIICVGDDNQSIYAFINNINLLLYLKENNISDITIKNLTNSFRFESGSEIENLANIVLRHRNVEIKGVADYSNDKDIKDILFLGRSNAQVFLSAYELASIGKFFLLLGGISLELKEFFYDINYIFNKEFSKVKSKLFKEFSSINELKEFALAEKDQEILSAINLLKFLHKSDISLKKFFFTIEKFNKNKFFVNARPNPTYLSTIHKAKGLEYDKVVILPKISDSISVIGFDPVGALPNGTTILNIRNETVIKEELNLLYVAITRAKKSIEILNEEFRYNLDFLDSDLDSFKIVKLSTYEFDKTNCTIDFPSLEFIEVSINNTISLIHVDEFKIFREILTQTKKGE